MVPGTTTKVTLTGNGDGPYPIPSGMTVNLDVDGNATDLIVTLTDSAGAETTLTLTTDYTVTGRNVYTVEEYDSTYTITISRDLDYTQERNLRNQSTLNMEHLESAFDEACMERQDLHAQLNRQIAAPMSDDSPDMELPPAALRKSQFMAFDSDGNVTVSEGTGTPASAAWADVIEELTIAAGLVDAGITASVAELNNVCDGATVSAAELNAMYMLGDIKYSFNPNIGAAHGFLPFGSDAVSQTGDYADLYAVVGDMFEAAYTGLGYAASGAGMFYPAPPPQLFPRAAIPRVAVAAADFDNANDRIDDDDSLTSGVAPFHIHRDGTAVRFSAGDGTLPAGITEGTVYYARKVNSDQAIELWTTEAAAVSGSGTQVTDFSGASGTVYMYNAGLYVADAMQRITGSFSTETYNENALRSFDSADGAMSTNGSGGGAQGPSYESGTGYRQPEIDFDSADSPDARTTNESRAENILLYGYIKAKAV